MDICDFCSSPNVVKRFACRDFDSSSEAAGVIYPSTRDINGPTDLVLASRDYWAACKDCAEIVEAQDIAALVQYVLDQFEKQDGRAHPRRKELEQHLSRTYGLFFRHRIEN